MYFFVSTSTFSVYERAGKFVFQDLHFKAINFGKAEGSQDSAY